MTSQNEKFTGSVEVADGIVDGTGNKACVIGITPEALVLQVLAAVSEKNKLRIGESNGNVENTTDKE